MLDIENQIFDYAKTYIISNSLYSPLVIKTYSNTSTTFPLVSIEEIEQDLSSENLNKSNRKTRIVYEINIFSQDKTVNGEKVSRHIINKELAKLVHDVFDKHYGFKTNIRHNAPNIDTSIKRTLITCTSIVDNEKLIIYRR